MSAGGRIESTIQIARVLWAALFSSSVVFAVVAFVGPFPARGDAATIVPLLVVAIGVGVASFLVPARLTRAGLAQLALRVHEVPAAPEIGGSAFPGDRPEGGGYRDLAPVERRFVDPESAVRRVLALGQTRLILSLALSEAVGLFGLALRVTGTPPLWVVPFFVAAWVLMLLRFPTRSFFLGPAEKLHAARF